MRVVGYVREGPGRGDTETSYAQEEQIRRWIRDTGHRLVAIFRDVEADRDGFRAMLDVLDADDAEAVVVADLRALSPDVVVQEVVLHDLRSRGVVVASTNPADGPALDGAGPPVRVVVRDVLARFDDHRSALRRQPEPREGSEPEVPVTPARTDVIVELIARSDNAAHTARPSA